MSHKVLDGDGVIKYVYSLGTGASGDPYRMVTMGYRDAMSDLGAVFFHVDRHIVANNAVFSYLLRTPTSATHVELLGLIIRGTSAPLLIDFYENSLVSANGTAETLHNKNRQTTAAAASLLYMNPTVTDLGTELMKLNTVGDKIIGGELEVIERIILKPSTNYLFRIENLSGAAATVALAIHIGED